MKLARGTIRILCWVQAPFGWAFWLLERVISDIDVEAERKRT
jgi:hypothetical protein